MVGCAHVQSGSVRRGGLSLNSLVLHLRPCALKSPLNAQRGRRSVPHFTEESRVSDRRNGLPRVTQYGSPEQDLRLVPLSHSSLGCFLVLPCAG